MIFHRYGSARLVVAVMLLCSVLLRAQPYSTGLDDNENPYDAPIPGFVGSGGEGKAPASGYEDEDNVLNVVNPLFLNWADTVIDYSPAPAVDAYWQYSGETLGEVTGDNFSVASLGDLDASQIASGVEPGSITVSFAEPIRNFSGADFAVFENGFVSLYTTDAGSVIGEVWAELAYVEVSSDGEHFARFPSISLTEAAVGAYGTVDVTQVYNLAGKHVNAYGDSWGTPFDLSDLEEDDLVKEGLLDLNAITHIRLVDIPGSGDYLDSEGNPIYDAWLTWGSGGADIEALGAISQELTYGEWAGEYAYSSTSDDDADGYTNFEEYAFRLDPAKGESEQASRLERDDAGQLFFVFRRDQRNSEVCYIVESTNNLEDINSWEAIAEFGPLDTDTILQSDEVLATATVWTSPQASVGVLQEMRLQIPVPDTEVVFYRVRLEEVE